MIEVGMSSQFHSLNNVTHNLHPDGASAHAEDVAGAVLGVLDVDRRLLRGVGTRVPINTLTPDIRDNAADV